MKIVLLNTYQTGGAARACNRLLQGLASASADACMVVRTQAQSPRVFCAGYGGGMRAILDGLPLHFYPDRQLHNFSLAWVPGNGARAAVSFSPDVVHLHWIVEGFVHINSLHFFEFPIVWTLHDSWPFTGGCHLPGECNRYRESCGSCPVLGSSKENDLSHRIWQQKSSAWEYLPLTIVSPSHWLADKARDSSLFGNRRIEVIPNGIDTVLFSPGDRSTARRELSLPIDRQLILFGANHALTDENKGFDLLQKALLSIDEKLRQRVELIVVGENTDRIIPFCGLPARNVGKVTDDRKMVQLYRAVDICIVPSRQENLPNMVIEAMACGTPCIAFAVGGIPELIVDGKTGFLARPYDVENLSYGIQSLLVGEAQRLDMAEQSRRWVESTVSIGHVATRYLEIYQDLLSEKG